VTGQRRSSRAESTTKQKLRLWLRLLRVAHSTEVELRRRFASEFKTTLPKFDVMAALSRAEHGMKMSELSRYLMVSNGNVTGIIDRLAAEEIVERRPQAGDRRATFVRLTAKGVARFAILAEAHEAWIGEILAHYSCAETETLFALLGGVRAVAQPRQNGGQADLADVSDASEQVQRSDADGQRFARRRGSGGSHVR
jgi:DNA-binding MarR family transcriptional regulator